MSLRRLLTRSLKRVPVLGPAMCRLRAACGKERITSGGYWDNRYRRGQDSGPGSYGELARFKAEIINAFVQEYGIQSVVEFGCGDGHQLSLMKYPAYVGLDVAASAVDLCRDRFHGDGAKRFDVFDARSFSPREYQADLVLSLDVIYHLLEDRVFDSYMKALFATARRFVIIYSDNEEKPTTAVHVRHRKFSNWIEKHVQNWRLLSHIPNRFPFDDSLQTGSWADFWIYARGPASQPT